MGGYNTNHFFRVDRGFVAQTADVPGGRIAPMSAEQRVRVGAAAAGEAWAGGVGTQVGVLLRATPRHLPQLPCHSDHAVCTAARPAPPRLPTTGTGRRCSLATSRSRCGPTSSTTAAASSPWRGTRVRARAGGLGHGGTGARGQG